MKLYIPHFIDVHKMESKIVWEHMDGGSALSLSQVINLIARGITTDQWVFQSIDYESRLVDNVYVAEILSWFGGWAFMVDGEFQGVTRHLKDLALLPEMKSMARDQGLISWMNQMDYQIGYQPTGACLFPVCSEFLYLYGCSIHGIFESKGNCPKYYIHKTEDLLFISTLEIL